MELLEKILLLGRDKHGGPVINWFARRGEAVFVNTDVDESGTEHWTKVKPRTFEGTDALWFAFDILHGGYKQVKWDKDSFPTVAEARTLLEGEG